MTEEKIEYDAKPRHMKRVVLKEELVILTGDALTALVLNQFIYWSERIKDVDKYIREEKQRNPEVSISPTYGWIYKNAEELAE